MTNSDFTPSNNLRRLAEIRSPQDAEQPILHPHIRANIHQWMTEIRAEDELKKVGVEARRNAILSGPPGCGKTTLAHHLAARLGLHLVSVRMDRIQSMYVGQTANNMADIFEEMIAHQENCVLFLDEFDAVGSKRTNAQGSADRDHNGVVDALLARIEQYKGMMIAATNHADHIDPAIWRRFGMHMEIPLPGPDERFAILTRYLHPYTLPDEAIDFLTDATAGAAPSLLRQLMEGIKRDLILGQRLNYDVSPGKVFARILASVKPHKDYMQPPLWIDRATNERCADMNWPPQIKDQ